MSLTLVDSMRKDSTGGKVGSDLVLQNIQSSESCQFVDKNGPKVRDCRDMKNE